MNQAIQVDHSNTQLALPMKRKRGRPRKDPSLPRMRSVQRPLGVDSVKNNQTPQIEKNIDVNDAMVGKAVTGIVEAVFDAGYLLSIRIGDSNTNLRGIVFKPGHYVPITAENDVAPHVQMIQRNETQIPVENQKHGHKRFRQKQVNRASKAMVASLTVVAPSVPPVGARGTLVPVVLQPVNLTNGASTSQVSSDASQAAFQEKDVQMVKPLAMLPPVGSTTMTNTHVVLENDSVSEKRRDVSKGPEGIQRSSLPSENSRQEIGDMNEPPLTETSEAVQPNPHNSKSISKTFMNYGTGRMTELLQALQENLIEIQKPDGRDLAVGLRNESNGMKFTESEDRRGTALQ
ncbi:PREDICTED: uncharacterized protein LOC109190478 isoform X2 [Ipomoea nil]|uniref:uncharacterized protein LOC109190478 isoform X2 n=1 Tax=Ipomoea nil TaxID=35883 RepID=UPI0009015546|nr:PREDICTED: uncharacterized protein LOC109190478 isoform X2 [Ipomoea nil]